ncbi:hypothetical protein K490DRAFT_46875 [Saccharata proteae CBS 121410]|uniref:Uncharacterized protein n=1 Tax=Saccharata proteae CBS 121410 TaxID=1314787 RepID=A0A9P4HR49_9PEZI|nr:hypothetical protein K490DRAFT_46875 [Saccharata proteae CBS 121410]
MSPDDITLGATFARLNRSTKWDFYKKWKLRFPTYHPQGLCTCGSLYFLTSVEVIEAPSRSSVSSSSDGSKRLTPGRGRGHLFILDRFVNVQSHMIIGEGSMYHPGGIDADEERVWIPVSEYRPNSRAVVYSVHAETLSIRKEFQVNDHVGNMIVDRDAHRLFGTTWGSRQIIQFDMRGNEKLRWSNPSQFIDYQDCQYVSPGKAICGGVVSLPQSHAAISPLGGKYELGGVAMIDLDNRTILHEVPLPEWSTAGHAVTRNPLMIKAGSDGSLVLLVAPDNGDEAEGTELLLFVAAVRD